MNLYIFNFKLFLLVFFTTICGCMVITLFMVETYLEKKTELNKNIKNYKYLFLNGKADWVALGDSHPARSLLNSFWLDNLGFASDNLKSKEQKALHRINRLKPEGIILPADPQLFSFYRLSDDQTKKTKYLISEKAYFFKFLNPINRPYLITIVISIYKNKFKNIFNIKKTKSKKPLWIDIPLKERKLETSIRVQLHTPIPQFQSHSSYKKYQQMVRYYLQLDIKVCLVRYPISKLYLDEIQSIKVFNQVDLFFKTIAKENNLNYVDLSDLLDNNKFTDTDHIISKYKNIITNLVKKGCKIND